jgi:VWFA-related protein
MKRRGAVLTMLLTLAITGAAPAQRVDEGVQVTIVEVPVTVVDRDGNPVRGLTADNFELSDDGKRVPIEYFEVLDLSSTKASEESGPLPRAATRHFLLMFDVANSAPGTIERASEAAKEFVNRQLGPNDLAAVATFTAEAGARMVTNFTKDRTLLTNAIETLGNPKFFKVADPLMISAIRTGGGESGSVGPGSRSAGDSIAAEMAREQERLAKRTHDSEMRNRLRIQFTNLGNVARVLDRLPGQKQVILLSEGFDASLVQGRENIGAAATAEADSVMSGEVWNVDSEERFGSTTSSSEVRELTELFRRSDVVMHAIDIKGLRGSSDVSSAAGGRGKSFESLFLITSPTGGTVFKNTNDIATTFERMMKRQEVVYLLGFQARDTGKPGKFHTLKVKTATSRGGRVTHRPGYYEVSSKMSDLERSLTLAEILTTDAPIDDIVVNLGVTALPGPGGKARVPVVVEIPSSGLLKGLSGRKASAQIFLYAFNESGQVVDHLQERVNLDLDSAGDALQKGGIRYYASLRMPAGTYAVKALVRVEETGLIGFKRNDVRVPAFDQPAIAQPVGFEEAGQWPMLVGPARGDDFAYPFAAGEAKYIPKSVPEVKANQEYKVALFLYRVPLENLSVTSTLAGAGDVPQPASVRLLGRTSADERGAVKLLFAFDPKNIAAGSYQLRFDVTSKDGTRNEVALPFIVR